MTRVLVVDDNARNRKLARDVLEAAGFDALEATTGQEGVALAAEHRPDVILLDLRLPDMHGVEVVRQLQDGELTASDPGGRDECDVAPGARRLAPSSRLHRQHRQADPRPHVPGPGSPLLFRAGRLNGLRCGTLLAPL